MAVETGMSAVPVAYVPWREWSPAAGTLAFARQVATAVGVERGRTVGTHDAEILDPVVVTDPVDVIEDKRHPPPFPGLALAAQLAPSRLESLFE
jgi:hypothetical protein